MLPTVLAALRFRPARWIGFENGSGQALLPAKQKGLCGRIKRHFLLYDKQHPWKMAKWGRF